MKRNLGFAKILENQELREELFAMLRAVAIFGELGNEELLELLRVMEHVLYDPREQIFVQNSDDRNLHFILNGEVFLYVEKVGGAQEILARMGRNRTFGEIAFITGTRRSAAALAGPTGSEQLVLTPARFNEFLAHHPKITFKMMRGILDDIQKRTDFLPGDLANYAIWGYVRQQKAEDVERLRPTMTLRGTVTALLTVLGGIGGWYLGDDLDGRIPSAASMEHFQLISAVAGTFTGAVLGFFFGYLLDFFGKATARNRRSDRCCMNCKYIQWDETDLSFLCVYREMQLSHAKVEPGEDYDTFTSCPSFAYRGTAKVKMRERDMLHDGRD